MSAALRHPGSLGFPGSGGSTRGRSAAFKTRKWCGFEARPAHSVRYGVIGSPRGSGPRSPGPSPGTAAGSASPPAGSQLRIWAAAAPAVDQRDRGTGSPRPPTGHGRRARCQRSTREARVQVAILCPFSSMAEHSPRMREDAGPVPARGSQAGNGDIMSRHRPFCAPGRECRRSRPGLIPPPGPPRTLSGGERTAVRVRVVEFGRHASLRCWCSGRSVRVQIPPRTLGPRTSVRSPLVKAGCPGWHRERAPWGLG